MRAFLFLLFYLVTANCLAQRRPVEIIVGGGPSFNGSGDLGGYTFFNQVDVSLGKRFALSPGLHFTSHAGNSVAGRYEFRYVTTGINLYTQLNYYVLNRPRHRIALGLGPVVRYQSNPNPGSIGLTNGTILDLYYYEPINSFSLGYHFSPAYYFRINRKFFIGGKGVLQNDLRGDIITSAAGFIGVVL